MKNIKLIVITILIVVYSSLIYANNEIVEKDGNTTKIKLLDEEDNENSNKKLFENINNKNKYDTLLGNNTFANLSTDSGGHIAWADDEFIYLFSTTIEDENEQE